MKTFLCFFILASCVIALPWCNTQNCNIAYTHRSKVLFSHVEGTIRITPPDAKSFIIINHKNNSHEEVPMNDSYGSLFFNSSEESEFFLYYSNKSIERDLIDFPVEILPSGFMHPEEGASKAIDREVGDLVTHHFHFAGYGQPPEYFYKDLNNETIVKLKVKMILLPERKNASFGICGMASYLCVEANCYVLQTVSMEVCKDCNYSEDPVNCITDGKAEVFAGAQTGSHIRIYDVAVEYDYVFSDETAVLIEEEKAPDLTVKISNFQEVGKIKYSIENSGSEASYVEVNHSDFNLSRGVHDLNFSIFYNNISKIETKTVVLYSKEANSTIRLINSTSGVMHTEGVFFVYSDRNYSAEFKECGFFMNVSENSSDSFLCSLEENVSIDNLGFSLVFPIESTGNFKAANILKTPPADKAEIYSDHPFIFSGTELKVFYEYHVNVTNLELGELQETEYPENLMISLSSDLTNPLQNASVRVKKENWAGYSTHTIEDGVITRVNSAERNGFILIPVKSANENVILSFDSMKQIISSGGGGGSVNIDRKEEKEHHETVLEEKKEDKKEEEKEVFFLETGVETNGFKAVLKVSTNFSECIYRVNNGLFEKLSVSSGFSEKVFLGLSEGQHSIEVKCFNEKTSMESEELFSVGVERQEISITAMSAAGGNLIAGAVAFVLVIIVLSAYLIRLRIKSRLSADSQ